MNVVLVGGPGAAGALPVLEAAGLDARPAGSAADLESADRAQLRYVLVHVGADDGEPGGSFARAHHRVEPGGVAALAERLRPRERTLVTCLAFGFQHGLPADAAWLVDVRFLDNPYWDPELRPLSGLEEPVRAHVLGQPAAVALLDRLVADLAWAVPLYGRPSLTVAIGCTGGRHRSVVIAGELARRLAALPGLDAEAVARDLEPAG